MIQKTCLMTDTCLRLVHAQLATVVDCGTFKSCEKMALKSLIALMIIISVLKILLDVKEHMHYLQRGI